jgi:serine/threonine protein kinase
METQTPVGLPIKIVRRLTKELLLAVAFLHNSLRVCHRDIKLEHIFLDRENSVRLGGFGMAVPVTDVFQEDEQEEKEEQNGAAEGNEQYSFHQQQQQRYSNKKRDSMKAKSSRRRPSSSSRDEVLLTVMCGSRHYAAPEIVDSVPYKGTAADMWSVGVCVFALLTGSFPFPGGASHLRISESEGHHNILRPNEGGDVAHRKLRDSEGFSSIASSDAQDFIMKLLTCEPLLRMTAAQALRHSFLSSITLQ